MKTQTRPAWVDARVGSMEFWLATAEERGGRSVKRLPCTVPRQLLRESR